MVDTAVAPPSTAPTPPRRRQWWRTLWFLAPLLFLVVLVAARVVYWRTSIAYRPLELAGPAGAAVGQPSHVAVVPGGLRSTAPTGTEQLFEFPLRNDGIHALDINAVTAQDDAVVGVQWAANFVQAGHRVPSPTHALPAHVPGHATVNLQLLVRQPACTKGTARYLAAVVTIHWHAMISPHATRLNLLAGNPHRIALCAG
jgi:hypothetical protein